MLALVLKALHVLSAVLFLGTGLGSAWYKLRADGSGQPAVVAWAQQEIVRADWIFTVPSGLALPLSGAALVEVYGLPWATPWVLYGVGGYAVAGLCWLPAAWLQLRMRADAEASLASGAPLPDRFHRDRRTWFLLGIPSFAAAMFTLWIMITKWTG